MAFALTEFDVLMRLTCGQPPRSHLSQKEENRAQAEGLSQEATRVSFLSKADPKVSPRSGEARLRKLGGIWKAEEEGRET